MRVFGPILSLAIALAVAPPVQADCRLALLLALDVSSSVDSREDRLQRKGLANALLAEDVQKAILSVPGQFVALAAFEWSGRYSQQINLDWVLLENEARIRAAADAIRESSRSRSDLPTAIGHAAGFAAGLLSEAPDCLAQTIDVSGDGENNEGFPPKIAYRHFGQDFVTVNGLAIGGKGGDLPGYYRRELIKGPGAFVIEADDFADFERAMKQKLIRETEAKAVARAVP